jgi:hypothetical protein
MIMSISLSARKGILVVALALAVMLSWSSIRAALAAHYAGLGTLDGYTKATQLEPSSSKNWDLLGRYWLENLEQPDVRRAIESYRISLSLDSLSVTTWLDLASAYEIEGDVAAARTAYLQAKHVYPISADVAWRYGNFLLRQGESAAGLLEIHRAVEAEPRRGLEAFLTCRHVEPNFDLLLDRVLAPVASIYVEVLWRLTDEGDTHSGLKVWSKLIALRPKLTQREVFFFVDGLLHERQVVEALKVWREATPLMDLPKLEDPPGSLIWDGGFETDITGGGLAWRVEPYRPIKISYDSKIRHSGKRALRVDISKNDNSDFLGVCQWVVLEPNTTYEFSAWLRTRDLAKDGGILFRLTHPGDPAGQDIATPKLAGTNEWTKVSVHWNSPHHLQVSHVCLSRAFDPESSQLPGVAWVDDVSLLKLGESVN